MSFWRAALLTLTLLGSGVVAHERAQDSREDGHPSTRSPRLIPPQLSPLRPGLSEIRRVLEEVTRIRAQLRVGEPQPLDTPQGPRLILPLRLEEEVVALIFINSDGQFIPLGQGPRLSSPSATPRIDEAQRAGWQKRVEQLTPSGAIQGTPKLYRVLLLWQGQAVAALHLKRPSLKVRSLELGEWHERPQGGHP